MTPTKQYNNPNKDKIEESLEDNSKTVSMDSGSTPLISSKPSNLKIYDIINIRGELWKESKFVLLSEHEKEIANLKAEIEMQRDLLGQECSSCKTIKIENEKTLDEIKKWVDKHRNKVVITCIEDCWCWKLDNLINQARARK